jgi:hypothetical protein
MHTKDGSTGTSRRSSRPQLHRASSKQGSDILDHETIQHSTGSVLHNDAKACFDQIIENIGILALLAQGLPIKIARLHSQTFQQLQYHTKHKLGIGSNTHSHNHPEPIYGAGQGASNVLARWGFLCNHLIQLYKTHGLDAILQSPISS